MEREYAADDTTPDPPNDNEARDERELQALLRHLARTIMERHVKATPFVRSA
jgi:hypothetical protein